MKSNIIAILQRLQNSNKENNNLKINRFDDMD